MNPLQQLADYGQSPWLDDIHRDLITSGQLQRLIEQDGLRGMTSNPAIFKKAIADSSDYEEDIRELKNSQASVKDIFEALAVKDVQLAADVFRPLYDRTEGEHGYVSLEVNPYLARYTQGTIEEARRLWHWVARPNIFIKVPGTAEGLPAITQLISEGININVTLLFGLPRYEEVANAYMEGIERRVNNGKAVANVRSVASFFLSRIDVLLDPKLEALMEQGGGAAPPAKQLRGEIAIASAKSAYQIYQGIVSNERWKKLAQRKAKPQWLLWASTSTKNPDYSDVKYIEPLIGPETINTMPMETLEAYRDHGKPQRRIEADFEQSRRVLTQLAGLGLDLNEATELLEHEGIQKFCQPFDALLATLEREVAAV